jgi:predicted amidohydrolase YtcJ
LGIQAAVNRSARTVPPREAGIPENRVTVEEALSGHIPPYRQKCTKPLTWVGVAPGKKADLVVLSNNILHAQQTQLAETLVDMTFFEGQRVYQRT